MLTLTPWMQDLFSYFLDLCSLETLRKKGECIFMNFVVYGDKERLATVLYTTRQFRTP